MLHHLLKKSAEHYPDKPAVRCGKNEISYQELNFLSDQLSFSLAEQGVAAGGRVGMYMDKSVESIVAIFGILKAGACYVPLDPVSPVQRQSLIINDCSLNHLVASSKKASQIRQILNDGSSLRHLLFPDTTSEKGCKDIDDVNIVFQDEILNARAVSSGPQQLTADNLAYILYTSGSTGQPKGVMISHKASLAFVNWACDCFKISSDDRLSAHAPFHFDLSIFDIFVSIQAGATICIIPQGLSAFPQSLADFVEKEEISVWYSVPSVLTSLMMHGDFGEKDLSALRTILFAGEVFPTKHLRKLMQTVPHVQYCNLYGPTETNVITYCHVENVPDADDSIPIGNYCTGVEGFIVDESGRLAQDGAIGELYVSGPTLMDGYWNDAQKTERVLFNNPFTPNYKKVYKTGDMVSINEQGHLSYHGRCDYMIKSRGYRIELTEIESVLSAHPHINEAAVLGIPDEKIGKKIKAVLVPKGKDMISARDVELFCARKLPHYMIPEQIIFVDDFPRTSTNKIDRKRLEMEAK